jgi:hypothetical protein
LTAFFRLGEAGRFTDDAGLGEGAGMQGEKVSIAKQQRGTISATQQTLSAEKHIGDITQEREIILDEASLGNFIL